ncbi:G5 domain-containing protein, partial [Staphylococcus epidermidis]|nr:G5 domain-containing protein [Staphylococcus epidermidis]
PFDKKREFNPDLKPGEERVKQKGEPGTKTITTPTTKNPLTGEKVGEGEPTEEITKQPVDEIIEYGPTPDKPGNPDQPTPDEPGNPDQPTPDEPGNPDQPTPDEPGNPDQPTPDEPGNPDQPTPDEPGNPDQSKNVNHSTINKDHLPDTGDNSKSNQGILAGSLLSILGSLFIFGRRKNKDNSEK